MQDMRATKNLRQGRIRGCQVTALRKKNGCLIIAETPRAYVYVPRQNVLPAKTEGGCERDVALWAERTGSLR
jgi:hypothetical protein